MPVNKLGPTGAPRVASTEQPAQKPAATPAPTSRLEGWLSHVAHSAYDGVKEAVKNSVAVVAHVVDRLEHPQVDGKDGFVVLDPATGHVSGGAPGGAVVSDALLKGVAPRGLATMLALGDGGEKVTWRIGDRAVDGGATASDGSNPITLGELNQQPLKGLDPKKGGLLKVQVEAEGLKAEQRVLALPKDYDGPIFVSDIDDTLRPTKLGDIVAGETQEPIPGAKELLDSVAKRGVPIVYLSAGFSAMGTLNDEFLKQMPEGILLARPKMALADLSPSNHTQAERQGDYKAQRLAELHAAYPKAKIFGLGDDKYGDALAYDKAGASSYIHDVRPGGDNLPQGFHGVMTKDYDDAFRTKVLGDLDGVIAASDSFKR
jgi:hypothetical protein